MVLAVDYREFELHLSKESPGTYRACAMKNGNVAADQQFELRLDELKILEKLRFIEEQVVKIEGWSYFVVREDEDRTIPKLRNRIKKCFVGGN